MSGLPNVGGDSGVWGTELNTYLEVEHNPSTGVLLIRSDGTLLTPTAVKTSNYSANAGDFVPVDTTSANIIVTLPNAPAKVVKVGVMMVKGSTNHVNVNCAGSDQFDDDATTTYQLLLLNQVAVFQYNPGAARWYAISQGNSLGSLDARYSASSVITTLGDMLYENSTPAPARLAGNTSATKNFLTQTGTGSISAPPAWGTIASSDLPTGTTSAKGALQLDGTSGDIASTSSAAAAGSVGKAADAGHVHPQNFAGIFGDGSDGSVTLDGTTTFNSFSSLAGSTYTLTRDVFATNLTVNSGVTLNPSMFRIFCAGNLTNNGTIQSPGNAASGATKGSGLGSNTYTGGGAGGAGGTSTGVQGTSPGGAIGTGSGGAGGNGTSGSGGGTNAAATPGTYVYHAPSTALSGVVLIASGTPKPSGGVGGSSGAGDGTNSGGGGGSGAGIIGIFAYTITNSATGAINVPGGAGGSVTVGNVGGGGGGGGGMILMYTLSAWVNNGSTNTAGGAAGTGHGTGTNGAAGGSGTVLNVVVI